jgi:hypothetical protein
LVSNSSFVFVGRLKGKTVEKDSRELIITKNRFEVRDVLIGSQVRDDVTLSIFGGTFGDETLALPGMPEFEEGRDYVIFTDLSRTVYNPITGDQHGVFIVMDSLTYRYGGQGVVGVEDGIIQVGEEGLLDSKSQRLTASTLAENPIISGDIVSVTRAVPDPDTVMLFEDFERAVLAAAKAEVSSRRPL